jgi:hypothetical protein
MLGFTLTEAVGLLALMMAFLMLFTITENTMIYLTVPLLITSQRYKKTLGFWGHFERVIMRNSSLKGLAYYRILIVRLSTIYALVLYGILIKIYKLLKSIPLISYILADWDRIGFVQVIAVYFYPFQTCGFHLGLHSFLVGMEDIFYYLNRDIDYRKSVFVGLKFLRRSPIKSGTMIGRVGSDGFSGGMGQPPHGNWRRVLAWTGVAVSAIVANAIVKAHKNKLDAQATMHASNNNTRADMHASDNNTRADMHASDNKYDYKRRTYEMKVYREHLKAWEEQSRWTRGPRPTPPAMSAVNTKPWNQMSDREKVIATDNAKNKTNQDNY